MKFKLLLTMKLIVLLSLVLSLDVTASVYGQRIDLRMENASLESVLMEVQRQSNYNFLFNARYLKKARPVTVSVKGGDIHETLRLIFNKQPFDYQINGKIVTLLPKPNASPAGALPDRMQVSVRGQVTDTTGAPLPGVSVQVKGSQNGTSTDLDGNYELRQVAADAVLIFTFLGYQPLEVPVDSRSEVNVRLRQDVAALNEVVVVGYGTQQKANLTGAVSTIDGEMLESRPVQNVGQALQGIIPGLNFQTDGMGGELNNTLSFNIRGTGTIGEGSNAVPLVLIDGVEGDLNSINPQDIASVSVLKDAASASIYGSRAPFGVVLITTKRGKAGAPSVSYSNNFRWTSPMGLPEMLDSYTFALYWNEAAANDGEGAKFSQEVLDRIVGYQNGEIEEATVPNANGDRWQYYTGSNANTDWFSEQYKSSSFSQDHSLSISGGTDKTQYYASGKFMDQGGLLRYSGDNLKRYNLSGRLNTTLSDHVKFNYLTRYIREDYGRASHQFDLFYHNIARRWPTVPVRDPNGYFSDPSEIAQLVQGGRDLTQEDTYFMQGQLVVTPLSNWNIYAEGNYRIENINRHYDITPANAYDVDGNPFPIAVGWNSAGFTEVYEYNRKNNFVTTNIYSDYTFDIGADHHFKVLGGFNAELMKYRTLGASRSGLITPSLPTLNTTGGIPQIEDGQYQHWATAGFFGRLNYDYKGRYLLEVNARYDGTSRFMREKRWNLFPSFSAGWNIAEENFWNLGAVELFKLRGSYGELGNQNTANWYPFYLLMPVGTANGTWLVDGKQPNTAGAPGLVSTLLTWERVTSWNLGLDLSMLNNRLNLNVDYFNRKTFDMVGPAPELPVILGTAVPRVNNADMKSYGFEVEAHWRDRIGEFSYGIRAILSDDQQEIISYPNETGNIGTWYNGRKMGEIWGYTTTGIARTQEEMDAHLANADQNNLGNRWGAGDIMYADLNGDGKIDGGSGILENTGDRTIIGNSTPRYRYSFDLTGQWRGFDLRVFLQGVGKRDWMPNGPYFWGASGGMWQSAGFAEHMDYFRDESSVMVEAGQADVNLEAYFPKPYFNTGKNQQTQTRYLQNAAYLRVKNLQIGYSFPQSVTSRLGISKVRIYLSGENLFTFSKMIDIFDPETVGLNGWNDGKSYPFAKVYSLGLNVNF